MIGPLIVAIGFALFSLPTVGDGYWKSFFPAIIVLGFGMAVTVAPLTTVVMNSVKEDRAGTASGINNAVARVAGVLAIAVLGIVMVKAFSFRLDRSLAGLSLPSYIRQEVQANETKLAGLRLPAGLDPSCGRRDQGVGEGSVRIWIPSYPIDLRRPVSGECCRRMAHDSAETRWPRMTLSL